MLDYRVRPTQTLWCRGPARHPFKVEIVGSNPTRVANLRALGRAGCRPGTAGGGVEKLPEAVGPRFDLLVHKLWTRGLLWDWDKDSMVMYDDRPPRQLQIKDEGQTLLLRLLSRNPRLLDE